MGCKWCKMFERGDGRVIFKDKVVIITELEGRIYATGRNCMTPSPAERSWMVTKLMVAARRRWGREWWKRHQQGDSGHHYIEAGMLPDKIRKKNDKADAVIKKAKDAEKA